MSRNHMWRAVLASLLLVALAIANIGGQAGMTVAMAADPDGITETCGVSPQNTAYVPILNVGSVKLGDNYQATAKYTTTCEGAPWGFIFRRSVLRVPVGHTIYGYYRTLHDGSNTQAGCSINTVSGRQGVVCETTEINGPTGTATNPMNVVALIRVDTNTPCNVGVQIDNTQRRHYSPYDQLAYSQIYLAQYCA